jgi:hypothetical protein
VTFCVQGAKKLIPNPRVRSRIRNWRLMNGKTRLLAHLQPHLESLALPGPAKLTNTELNHLPQPLYVCKVSNTAINKHQPLTI